MKKFISLLLFLALVVSAAAAFATEPETTGVGTTAEDVSTSVSKTTDDATTVGGTSTSDDTTSEGGAATSGSKTTNDVTTIEDTSTSNDAATDGGTATSNDTTSDSGTSTSGNTTSGGGSSSYVAAYFWKTATSEITKNLQKELAEELSKNGSVSGYFPPELNISKTAQLAELFTIKADSAASGAKSFTIYPTTVIDKASKVTVLFRITDMKDNVTWFPVDGKVNADGEIAVTIPAQAVAMMKDAKDITVAVLVDKG